MAVPRAQSAADFTALQRATQESDIISKRQQSVFETGQRSAATAAPAGLSGAHGASKGVLQQHGQSAQSLTILMNSAVAQSVQTPDKRWGHTSAYLRDSNVALFIGGQVSSSSNNTALTNDVYALDLSANSTQGWMQLSSENLTPHAHAARAMVHDDEGGDQRIFIVGGSTADCSANASQIHMWTPGKSWMDGKWTVPTVSNMTERRRGTRAIQVPVQLGMDNVTAREAVRQSGMSFMMVGGAVDETTCGRKSSVSSNVDIWTTDASTAGTGRKAKNGYGSAMLNTRTLTWASPMSNMSFVDYSAVVLPANGSQGDRVLMLGGLDAEGNYAPFNQLWVLDLMSGLWSRMQTTNSTPTGLDIPLGRTGHTATRTENGTIIVYGGYVSMDEGRVPTSDVHVLDYTVNPAVWSRVNSSGAPSRAFHTAFMADQMMVVGFGQGDYNEAKAESVNIQARQSGAAAQPTTQAVQFLDTANPNGWSWSDSISAALSARQQAPAPAPTAVVPTSAAVPADASTAPAQEQSPATPASPHPANTAATNDKANEVAGKAADKAASPSPANVAAPAASSLTPVDSGATTGGDSTKQRTTAVVASVLGAAAAAAALGGLYAAHKRREARRRDDDSLSGDKYERFSSSAPGPPVSSLWLHQLKRKASMASEAFLTRGKSQRRGNTETSPYSNAAMFCDKTSYSTPMAGMGFQVLRNLPPTSRLSVRRQQRLQQEAIRGQLHEQENGSPMNGDLPDTFLHSILDDEELRARRDLQRTVGGGGGGVGQYEEINVPAPAVTMLRAPSSDSLDSDGDASHYSYPYLNAVQRPSSSNSAHSMGGSSMSSSPEESKFYSPRRLMERELTKAQVISLPDLNFSPQRGVDEWAGNVVVDQEDDKRSSFDSMSDRGSVDDIEAATTTIALRDPKSPSAMLAAATCLNSPYFPWDPKSSSQVEPMFPAQALFGAKGRSHLRPAHSTLRVTNSGNQSD